MTDGDAGQPSTTAARPARAGEPFFTWLAVAACAVVFAGFAPSFYLRSAALPPLSAWLAWHGVSLTLWYLLVIVQGALVGFARTNSRLRAHRRLGVAGLTVAVAVIVTGAVVAFDFYQNGTGDVILTPAGLLFANLMNLVSFAICFALGVALRRQPRPHKRFLALAGVLMIGPAAFRLVVNLGLAPPFSLVIQLGLLVAQFGYDRRRLGSIHFASWTGLGLIVIQIVGTMAIGLRS